MQKNEIQPNVVEGQEQVVLVHGTFASSDDDQGHEWWQIGSPTYIEIQKRLPGNVSLPKAGNLFRWSGDNNERARSKAAVELLDHVAPLEAEGKPYHLIGHSHGGSVIWNALRLATSRKKPLRHLQSWSTVGTPFLHHRTRSPWNVGNFVFMIMSVLLLVPATRTFMMLVRMPYDLVTGNLSDGIVMKHSQDAGVVVSVLRAPFVELLRLCGVTFTDTPDGIRMGSFTPGTGQSLTDFLFYTTEGWLILATIVVFGYLMLLLGIGFIRPVLESLRIRWEQSLERRAFEEYRERWLGIWTDDDEAINGLRATLELQVSFLARMMPRDRIFFSDSLSLLARPCLWVLGPFYNGLILPVLEKTIRGIVIRTAQGNNRPTAQVIAVEPCPILPPDAPAIPLLPEPLRKKILTNADRHAGDLGPKLRNLLAQPSFSAGLEKFSRELSGGELVHTSYFYYPEVLELLVQNIVWSAGHPTRTTNQLSSKELTDWFSECKRLLHNERQAQTSATLPAEQSSSEELRKRDVA